MRKKFVEVGTEYETNSGDTAIVLDYEGCEDVWVTFKDPDTPKDFRLKTTM